MTVQRVLIYGAGQRATVGGRVLAALRPERAGGRLLCQPQRKRDRGARGAAGVVPGRSLTDVVRDHDVEEIVVALTERRGGSMPMRELLDCKVQGVRVVDIARHFEQKLGQIRLDAMSAGYLIFGEGFNQGLHPHARQAVL
jgi:hypothetical protein